MPPSPTDGEAQGDPLPERSAHDEILDFSSDEEFALVDLVNRVLDKGVVIHGDVMISVAGVDLVYLGLNAVLTSVQTAREKLGQLPTDRPDGSVVSSDSVSK